jgi:hypothetical protein
MRILNRQLGLLLFTFFIMFCMAEFLLRTFSPLHAVGDIDWYQYDDELAVRLKPGMHDLQLSDHLSEIKTNAMGTVNFQESFEPYDVLIFAAGDSYTQGAGVAADASYPFQLDLLLNTEAGIYRPRYGVVNLGLAAYGSDQAILAIERYAELIGNPDYILYFGCSNDFEDDLKFENGYRHEHLIDGNPRYGIWTDLMQFLLNDVQVFKRAKFAVARMRDGIREQRTSSDSSPTPVEARDPDGLLNVARRQEPKFDRLVGVADRLGAVLIVSWTDFIARDHGSYAWLKAWSAANGVGFADWHPLVESVRQAMPQIPTANPHSGGHYRTWINGVIAGAYLDQVLLSLEPDSGRPDSKPLAENR